MSRTSRVALSILAIGAATAASAADTVTAHFGNFLYGDDVDIYREHETIMGAAGGLMDMTIDGETYGGYCVDLDHGLDYNTTYEAELNLAPLAAPWCQIGNIIDTYPPTDDEMGATVQAAIWKLLESPLTVDPFDAEAQALIDSVSTTCAAACTDTVALDVAVDVESDGNVYADLVLSRTGGVIDGQMVTIEVDGGTLLEPTAGYAETDTNGVVSAIVDPDGSPDDVTVTFYTEGRDLVLIDSLDGLQQIVVVSDPCEYSASGSYESVPFGDPRTIGFWKHQAKTALGGKGRNHVDATTLESWMPLEVLGLEVTTLDELYDALWLKNASMQERAQQQCLATTLNYSWGELGWYSEIDFDEDGAWDAYFYEYWNDAQDYYDAGDYEAAKDICDGINNL